VGHRGLEDGDLGAQAPYLAFKGSDHVALRQHEADQLSATGTLQVHHGRKSTSFPQL
jgi:hypothetical protein